MVILSYFLIDILSLKLRGGRKRKRLTGLESLTTSLPEDYPAQPSPTPSQSLDPIPILMIHATMAEPQPPTIQEGIDPEGPPPPTGTDARKAAAALSSLDARGDEDETAQSSTVKNIDQEALVNAISRLELTSGKATPGGEEQKKREAERKRERERRAKIKVDGADVGLLVSGAVD